MEFHSLIDPHSAALVSFQSSNAHAIALNMINLGQDCVTLIHTFAPEASSASSSSPSSTSSSASALLPSKGCKNSLASARFPLKVPFRNLELWNRKAFTQLMSMTTLSKQAYRLEEKKKTGNERDPAVGVPMEIVLKAAWILLSWQILSSTHFVPIVLVRLWFSLPRFPK